MPKIEPWAKLMTSATPKISETPSAIRANGAPAIKPLTSASIIDQTTGTNV
jgi:hypothetical protein